MCVAPHPLALDAHGEIHGEVLTMGEIGAMCEDGWAGITRSRGP